MFSRVIEHMLNFMHMPKSLLIYLYVRASLKWVLDESLSACATKLCSRRVMFFKILRSHHSFFFLLHPSPIELIHKVCTVCNEFSNLWILDGALVQAFP